MANFLLVLLALCVALAPSIVAAEYKDDTFFLKGFVYCDTCRCGYETSASKCLPGNLSSLSLYEFASTLVCLRSCTLWMRCLNLLYLSGCCYLIISTLLYFARSDD